MYCADTKTLNELKLPPEEYPCVPEMVYAADNGLPTGLSTVGYRSAKFAPKEANQMLEQRYAQSDQTISLSERIRSDTHDLILETDTLSKKNTENLTKRLDERLKDTNFWKTELEREITDMINVTGKLVKRKRELENALMVVEQAIHICTDNLNARRRHYGEDLQQDDVELQLIKELDILNKSANLYKQSIEQCENQFKRNRDSKQDLEMIWSDKLEASQLLEEAGRIDVNSTNKQFYAGEARRYPLAAQSTVESLAQHTHDAILRSEHERMASEELMTVTSNIIHDVSNDIVQQKDTVNAALQKQLTKYESELATYQKKLKETTDEISKVERLLEELRCAISDKDNYIKLVQTRLHLHNQRPGVENARDPAQKAMLDELVDLEKMLDRLNDQMIVTETNLKRLHDNQMMLEKQIQSKQHAIQVDCNHLVRHRAVFPDAVRLQGH
ncbi:Tektin-4 [Paragonimus heterotremus]|uniref:Tektin n=1 Tax=Paragonimus heterotremus TaxID=100268 RepID=A0A8J4WTM4_9TREM|nr:Tektin-4 [Paragonimus heterotremus]